jgi:hypothetical protein
LITVVLPAPEGPATTKSRPLFISPCPVSAKRRAVDYGWGARPFGDNKNYRE